MLGKNATRILSLVLSDEMLLSPIAAAITIIDTPMPITYEIFIKQRYNSRLNSKRILAEASPD